MIDEIQVQNLALIREVTLEPSAGLTVLTGETGAGKTALLSALKLLMGARASADLVRDGETGLVVSGRFFGRGFGSSSDSGSLSGGDSASGSGSRSVGDSPSDPGSLSTADSPSDPGSLSTADSPSDLASPSTSSSAPYGEELVVTRKVSSDGRSRATIDGEMASMRELTNLVAPTVDLCGQFEHQQLMRPSTHVALLDAWAADDIAPVRETYQRALAAANEANCELERVREAGSLSSAKLEDARFTLRRIDEVGPAEGEFEALKHDLEIAEHAESLANAVSSAHAALSGDGAALDMLNEAASALEGAGRVDAELAALGQSLREAGYVLEDVSAQARDYRDGIEFDAEVLAQQQERFSQLQGLLRAYGPRIDDVFERRAQAAEVVSLVDDSEARLRAAERHCEEAESALAVAADALDDARAKAAPRFVREVTAVMARLEMGTAELAWAQERLPRASWATSGPSNFEFQYCPTSGAHPRPLVRIASGGEMSRVMLAVKVVLGTHDDVDTLVFDEVDAGVGGSTAVALAEVIADLARTHQVIVVTHLAQVAVRGDVHYVVTRESDETRLVRVTGGDREREIARMLSGSFTDTSIAHARELLADAGNAAVGPGPGPGPDPDPGNDSPEDEQREFAAIAASVDAAAAASTDDSAEQSAQLELDITSQILRSSKGKRIVLK